MGCVVGAVRWLGEVVVIFVVVMDGLRVMRVRSPGGTRTFGAAPILGDQQSVKGAKGRMLIGVGRRPLGRKEKHDGGGMTGTSEHGNDCPVG